jgi:hypothetical protein
MCGCGPCGITEAEAIAAWNTRPLEQQLAAKVRELENELVSRRVDSEQLERISNSISSLCPLEKTPFGGISDHAEAIVGKILKERDELRAVLDWRPIAEAPRDGTMVDLWIKTRASEWRYTDCAWREGCWQRLVNCEWEPVNRDHPTHFLPLPKAPEKGGAA